MAVSVSPSAGGATYHDDHHGLLSPSVGHQESSLVRMANSILSQLHVPRKIRQYTEINGSLFVTIYEGLCGELLPDVIRNPRSVDDDIHNAQTVIDALALEVLHTSLSHISGEAIAKGDRTAVGNLLDLFSSLMEFILNRIECDLSDTEEVNPDRVTSELIDDILSRDIGDQLSLDDNDNYVADPLYDDDVKDRYAEPHDHNGGDESRDSSNGEPPRDQLDEPRDRLGNSTLELIRESQELERKLRAEDETRRRLREEEERIRIAEDRLREETARQRALEEDERRREADELRIVEEAMARYGENTGRTRLTELDGNDESSDALPLFDTPSKHSSQDFLTPSKRDQYNSLLSLTEETSELARSAVVNSPARATAERSAFLEAAIKSALKKIDREARGVEKLVGDMPKKSVRLKLSDEFCAEIPRKQSPMKTAKPYHPKYQKHLADSDEEEEIPRPTITISSAPVTPKSAQKTKKSIPMPRSLNKRASAREKTDHLRHLYAYDYKNIVEDQKEISKKSRERADAVEKSMRKNLSKSSRKSRPLVVEKTILRGQRKSSSLSPPKRQLKDSIPPDSHLFHMLDAFPSIHLSTDTVHDLWRQSVKQIEQLNKIEQETKRKDQLHAQLEQASRRQQLVSEIFRKDLEHRRRMTEIKARNAQKRAVKQGLQDKRAQSARIRRYYDEFQAGMRSKMLNKRVRDELIFKRVFKDGLNIQRQCIRDMRKYAKEQRTKKSRAQQDEIESLENFYRDQFLMLAEATEKERKDVDLRQKAQSNVIDRMKRELRQKMEVEIRNIQTQLCEEDDGHFRQLDADRLHQDLLLNKYKAYV